MVILALAEIRRDIPQISVAGILVEITSNGLSRNVQKSRSPDRECAPAGPFITDRAPASAFAIGVKHALDVTVQRSHDADPREHRRTSERCDQHQRFHRVCHSSTSCSAFGSFQSRSAVTLQPDFVVMLYRLRIDRT
jgi:hypothetical protein